jgi:hypothetical protein
MRERAAAAVPFLMRLQVDIGLIDAGSGYYFADKALVAIGEPALTECIAAARTGQWDALSRQVTAAKKCGISPPSALGLSAIR